MNEDNPVYVVGVALLIGIMVYLGSAVWSALFVPAVPMDADWCHDGPEALEDRIMYDVACFDFKNDVEMAKYYHNSDMLDRNRRWVYGTWGFGAVMGLVAFYLVPRRREGQAGDSWGMIAGGAMVGWVSSLFVPWLLSLVLPAPATWFPAFMVELAQQRIDDALSDIVLRMR